jgi:hypothetical protein
MDGFAQVFERGSISIHKFCQKSPYRMRHTGHGKKNVSHAEKNKDNFNSENRAGK